jgi:hypothetical protein
MTEVSGRPAGVIPGSIDRGESTPPVGGESYDFGLSPSMIPASIQ